MRRFLKRRNRFADPLTRDLPTSPGVYAIYTGRYPRRRIAFVGMTESLRGAITRRLTAQDEGDTSGDSASYLSPYQVTGVRWWTRPDFSNVSVREAAKLIALDVLLPAQKRRTHVSERAAHLCKNKQFRRKMRALFRGAASGYLTIPTLQDTLEEVAELKKVQKDMSKNIAELERSFAELRYVLDEVRDSIDKVDAARNERHLQTGSV